MHVNVKGDMFERHGNLVMDYTYNIATYVSLIICALVITYVATFIPMAMAILHSVAAVLSSIIA